MILPDEARRDLAPWFTEDELALFRYTDSSLIAWVFRNVFKQGAVTWNKVVNFARRSYDPEHFAGKALIAHELFHILHQDRIGWWRYLGTYVFYKLNPRYWRRGVKQHPMERDAYALQDEVERALNR